MWKYRCEACNLICNTAEALKQHLSSDRHVHRVALSTGSAGRMYYCKLCNCTLSTEHEFKQHKHGRRPQRQMKIYLPGGLASPQTAEDVEDNHFKHRGQPCFDATMHMQMHYIPGNGPATALDLDWNYAPLIEKSSRGEGMSRLLRGPSYALSQSLGNDDPDIDQPQLANTPPEQQQTAGSEPLCKPLCQSSSAHQHLKRISQAAPQSALRCTEEELEEPSVLRSFLEELTGSNAEEVPFANASMDGQSPAENVQPVGSDFISSLLSKLPSSQCSTGRKEMHRQASQGFLEGLLGSELPTDKDDPNEAPLESLLDSNILHTDKETPPLSASSPTEDRLALDIDTKGLLAGLLADGSGKSCESNPAAKTRVAQVKSNPPACSNSAKPACSNSELPTFLGLCEMSAVDPVKKRGDLECIRVSGESAKRNSSANDPLLLLLLPDSDAENTEGHHLQLSLSSPALPPRANGGRQSDNTVVEAQPASSSRAPIHDASSQSSGPCSFSQWLPSKMADPCPSGAAPLHCALCNYTAPSRTDLADHLGSEAHLALKKLMVTPPLKTKRKSKKGRPASGSPEEKFGRDQVKPEPKQATDNLLDMLLPVTGSAPEQALPVSCLKQPGLIDHLPTSVLDLLGLQTSEAEAIIAAETANQIALGTEHDHEQMSEPQTGILEEDAGEQRPAEPSPHGPDHDELPAPGNGHVVPAANFQANDVQQPVLPLGSPAVLPQQVCFADPWQRHMPSSATAAAAQVIIQRMAEQPAAATPFSSIPKYYPKEIGKSLCVAIKPEIATTPSKDKQQREQSKTSKTRVMLTAQDQAEPSLDADQQLTAESLSMQSGEDSNRGAGQARDSQVLPAFQQSKVVYGCPTKGANVTCPSATSDSGHVNPESNIEDMLLCPITQDFMVDPCTAEDGYTYEAMAIKRWLLLKGTSPMTRKKMGNRLVPNHLLCELRKAHGARS